MASRRLHFANGNVILVILRPVGSESPHLTLATLVDEELRQPQIPAILRAAIEFNQRQLNFWVAAGALALTRAKDRVDMIGQVARDIEEPGIAQGPLKGDRRLKEMAGAVQLVAVIEIEPALIRLDHGVIAIQLAIGLLRCDDQADDLLGHALQVGVRAVAQLPGQCFQPLVDRLIGEIAPGIGAGHPSGSQPEVRQIARPLQHGVTMSEADLAIGQPLPGPEPISDSRRRERQRSPDTVRAYDRVDRTRCVGVIHWIPTRCRKRPADSLGLFQRRRGLGHLKRVDSLLICPPTTAS